MRNIKNIIKASKSDKARSRALLNTLKGKPVFEEKVKALNALFDGATIVPNR